MEDAAHQPKIRHTCPQCGDVIAADCEDAVIQSVIEHARRLHDLNLPDVVPLDQLRISIRKENENYWSRVDQLLSTDDIKTVFEAKLGDREREIVTFVVHGFTNKEIAKRLFVSTRTVSTHLVNIYKKLDVGSRAALVTLVRAADRRLEAGFHSVDVSKFGPFIPPPGPPKDT